MTNYIPKLYDRERERICNKLSDVDSYALTTDIWSSRHNQAYTGVTIHFVDSTYQLKAYLLETVEFPDAHTGVNIAEELQEILKNWKLKKPNCLLSQQIMEPTLWLPLKLQNGDECHVSATLSNLQWKCHLNFQRFHVL